MERSDHSLDIFRSRLNSAQEKIASNLASVPGTCTARCSQTRWKNSSGETGETIWRKVVTTDTRVFYSVSIAAQGFCVMSDMLTHERLNEVITVVVTLLHSQA